MLDNRSIAGYNKSRSQGPLVKRSRRRPLTPQTGVRFSHGSPLFNLIEVRLKAAMFDKNAKDFENKFKKRLAFHFQT